jgi:hypothetical protein
MTLESKLFNRFNLKLSKYKLAKIARQIRKAEYVAYIEVPAHCGCGPSWLITSATKQFVDNLVRQINK